MDTKEQIIVLENRLIEAMKSSDTEELDVLLADDLIFTGHTGQVFTKEMDMEAHRSGDIKIFEIETSEQVINIAGDVAIVSVKKEISGSFFGSTEVGIFRFTRVWKQNGTSWQIIAGHSSQVIS